MNINLASQQIQDIVVALTKDIQPQEITDQTLVRRKMSTFTYGLCVALANRHSLDAEALYLHYLVQGGLSKQQAHTVVERTSHTFIYEDFGQPCYAAGNQVDVDDFNYDEVFNLKQLIFG